MKCAFPNCDGTVTAWFLVPSARASKQHLCPQHADTVPKVMLKVYGGTRSYLIVKVDEMEESDVDRLLEVFEVMTG